ncbi:MAG: hypothetical protein OXI69_06110 [Acidobacteriota bacterium]|nr:hypothetical protein [Acidobacteriota bacterium]
MISRLITNWAGSWWIAGACLVLLCAATMISSGHPLTRSNQAGKFPVGFLTSKGTLQLTGRVDWGRGGRSPFPMIYDGTRIRSKSGKANLELLAGGRIDLCRDTDLTIQQPRSPFLLTLHGGSVAYDFPDSQGDLFLTPDFLIRVGPDPQLESDTCRGEITLEPDGTICVQSDRGLLEITGQDSSQALTVPPGPGMRVTPGRILSPEYFRDCQCVGSLPFRERNGPGASAYGSSRPAGRSPWKSFLRVLVKVLTLGLV